MATFWLGTIPALSAFGLIMGFWFINLAVLGLINIHHHPGVIVGMLNPWNAALFFANNGWHGFFVLGAVVLSVTGGEALYADMGHFGRRAILVAWIVVLLYAVCIVLRLARFNAMLDVDLPAFEKEFFVGMPAPAGVR